MDFGKGRLPKSESSILYLPVNQNASAPTILWFDREYLANIAIAMILIGEIAFGTR